jgi:hypothetical protein
LKPMFDEEPTDLKPLVECLWNNLGSITEHKDFEKNLKYADDSEIHEKTHSETEKVWYKGQM